MGFCPGKKKKHRQDEDDPGSVKPVFTRKISFLEHCFLQCCKKSSRVIFPTVRDHLLSEKTAGFFFLEIIFNFQFSLLSFPSKLPFCKTLRSWGPADFPWIMWETLLPVESGKSFFRGSYISTLVPVHFPASLLTALVMAILCF